MFIDIERHVKEKGTREGISQSTCWLQSGTSTVENNLVCYCGH